MFDVNPQSYKHYLRDVERQFARTAKAQTTVARPGLSRPRAILRRFADQGAQGAAVLVAVCVVVVFIL